MASKPRTVWFWINWQKFLSTWTFCRFINKKLSSLDILKFSSKMKCNFFHVVTIALAAIEQVLGENYDRKFLVLSSFSAGGLITGWPFINFILKREGFLNYLCQNGTNISTTVTCAEQDQAIGRYFSIMNALNTFIVLPFAVFMYNFDLFKSRIGCSILVTGEFL